MDLKQIKKLIEMTESSEISHLSIEEEGIKIEIKKEFSHAPAHHQVVLQQPTQAAAPVAAPAPAVPAAPAAPAPAAPSDDTQGLVPIKAQMVGTFYNSPNPDAAPYVKVGDSLSEGQVICIIEAMKLFNEIECEITGTIEKVCVENGQPVEFGQDLFLVRP